MSRHEKKTLRLLLGAGFTILLTFLLLYQAGALGERREWRVAALTTPFLGVALAVVLALYLRACVQAAAVPIPAASQAPSQTELRG